MLKKYFGTGAFYKSALMIALPVMGQSLIQSLVSLIDNFMVSGLGDVKMSGVNISGQILFVFMVLLSTICSTGGIFLTQFFGANDKKGMQQSLCYKIIMSSLCIGVYIFVCMVIPRSVLSLMVQGNSQADAILDEAEKYMFLMGFVGIPMVISNISATSLRETGQVKVPLVISVTATLINTFFNWVLIYGNLGAPKMEVQGAALATIIARCAEAVLYIAYMRRTPQPFAIELKTFRHVEWGLFGKILKKASMVIFAEMLWCVSETVTTALYNSRGGADVVSGMSAGFAIANLYFVAFGGINTATSIILGKLLGAGKLDEARRDKNWLLSGAVVFGLCMTVMGIATMTLVPVVFANLSESAQGICCSIVFWMALFMPVWVYTNCQFSISRAGGDTAMGMVVDGICTGCILLPGVFLLAWFTPLGPVAIYMVTKCVEFLKLIIAHFWLKKEKWVVNLAAEHAQTSTD